MICKFIFTCTKFKSSSFCFVQPLQNNSDTKLGIHCDETLHCTMKYHVQMSSVQMSSVCFNLTVFGAEYVSVITGTDHLHHVYNNSDCPRWSEISSGTARLYSCSTQLALVIFLFQEESDLLQHSRISNVTQQAAEYYTQQYFAITSPVNTTLILHCGDPFWEADCLSFQASSHSLSCHKYLLSLVNSFAFASAVEYFWRLPGLRWCFDSSGLITRDLFQLGVISHRGNRSW